MITTSHTFILHTPARQDFHDITDRVTTFVSDSGVTDGVAFAYTQHTSCCVLIQEESEDVTYFGTQLVLQDTLNVFAKIAPPARHEGQYLHPGPVHIKNAAELRDEHPSWGLNTDGHIISSILGRYEAVPVRAGRPVLGEFGRVYFGDLDAVRPRDRTVFLTIMGQ